MKRGRGAALALGCLAAAALGAVHCDARLAHAFGGYAYNETADCFYLSGAVDVIAGADPGQCPDRLRCYVAPDSNVYVTDNACDSPPDYQDETHATSGPCVKALAAFARPGNSLCPDAGYGLGGGAQ